MKFALINGNAVMPNLKHYWTLHVATCKSRELSHARQQRAVSSIVAESWRDAVLDIMDEDARDMGFTADDVHVHGCCK